MKELNLGNGKTIYWSEEQSRWQYKGNNKPFLGKEGKPCGNSCGNSCGCEPKKAENETEGILKNIIKSIWSR